MQIKERQYQEDQIDEIVRYLGKYKNVLCQLPTGGGKTVMFSKLAHRYYHKTGKKTLILVHREELMYQTKATMENIFGETMSLIKAGTKWVEFAPAYIGMVESVSKRFEAIVAEDMNIGLVIIDEAHNASFNKLHRQFTKEMIIGFTATPLSSSKKEPMNKYYSVLSTGPSIKTLIKYGNLAQNITRSPKEVIDKAKLSIASTGDYDINIMAQEFMRTKYVMSTYIAYMQYSAGKKAICFNVNIEHSKEVTKMFQLFNLPCKHVDGTTPDDERKEIFKWFHETPGAILCNVGIATLGFDEPTIETVIVNRATTSMALWLQMCGRGSRPIDQTWINENGYKYPYDVQIKSRFQIIDLGANCITHGDWSEDRDWRWIFNNPDIPKDGVAPMKECPSCGCYVHAAKLICGTILPETGEACDHIFDRKKYEEQQILVEWVTVTDDPDLERLMNNVKRGSYAAFFEAAVMMQDKAEASMEMTERRREQLFDIYFSFVRRWFKQAFPERWFDEHWHRELAKYNFNKYAEFKNTIRLEYVA